MENTLYYGDNLDMPPIRQVGKTFKRAEKHIVNNAEQLKLTEKKK